MLLVDDDGDLRLMLAEALRVEGHAVIDVPSGEEALAVLDDPPKIRVQSPDLVVLDLMMPGMSGTEVVRRLRTMARWAQLPVLILTGVNDPMLPVRLDLPVAFKPDVLDTIRRFAESSAPFPDSFLGAQSSSVAAHRVTAPARRVTRILA